MDSPVVRRIQQKLKDLRFYTGSVDGDLARPPRLLSRFPGANGLRADGKVGSNTMRPCSHPALRPRRLAPVRQLQRQRGFLSIPTLPPTPRVRL